MRSAIIVFIITLAVFLLTGWTNRTTFDFYVPLAQGFLQGRLYVDTMRYELHEMVSEQEVKTGAYEKVPDGSNGKFFVIMPPLPAVILMPVVAIWGEETNQSLISMVIASLSVSVAYLVFYELTSQQKTAVMITMLYAFGSMLWYHAIIGSGWYFSQICGLFFLWTAILAVLKKQHAVLIGVLLGLAYLSRYSLLLAFPFFLYLFVFDGHPLSRRQFKQASLFLITFAAMVCISLAYNFLRYGQVGHYGYTLLEQRSYNIGGEYPHGSYALSYAPRVLKSIFFSFPSLSSQFPFVIPSSYVMALWFVFPALFITLSTQYRSRIAHAGVLGIVSVLPTFLFHGGVGATQFGFRYALDLMPFLLLLIALSVARKYSLWKHVLILLSIVMNVWGVLFIN